jgi:hypothetical protein
MTATKVRPAHRPRLGSEPRVSITLSIDTTTRTQLFAWTGILRAVDPRASPGQVFDRMLEHCVQTNFNPTTE